MTDNLDVFLRFAIPVSATGFTAVVAGMISLNSRVKALEVMAEKVDKLVDVLLQERLKHS